MEIKIIVKEKRVRLVLMNNAQETGQFEFPEEHNLTEKLLSNMDRLLKKHKLTAENIEKITNETDLGESYTTRRIVEAVTNAWNWSKNNNS